MESLDLFRSALSLSESIVPIAIFISLAVLFLYKRGEKRLIGAFFLVFLIFLIGIALGKSALTYHAWGNDHIGQYLLWPHQSPWYFLRYAGFHFFVYPVLSLLGALLVWGVLSALKKYSQERLVFSFQAELGALFALLVGWIYAVPFLFLVFLFGIGWSLFMVCTTLMRTRKITYNSVSLSLFLWISTAFFLIGVPIASSLGLFLFLIPR